jgi:ribulose bisphosphate carboxylase small subunit
MTEVGRNRLDIHMSVEVDPSKLPDILRVLGELGITTTVKAVVFGSGVNHKREIESVAPAKGIKYNPELVSLVKDRLLGWEIPVISRQSFENFALLHDLDDAALSSRVFYCLSRRFNHGQMEDDERFSYMYADTISLYSRAMLRADKFSELNRKLEDDAIYVRGIGTKSKRLLRDVERLLIVPEPEQNTDIRVSQVGEQPIVTPIDVITFPAFQDAELRSSTTS